MDSIPRPGASRREPYHRSHLQPGPRYDCCGTRLSEHTAVVATESLSAFASASFDHIVTSNMVGVKEAPALFETFHRLLRPGGNLLCFEANHASPTVWWQDKDTGDARPPGTAPVAVFRPEYPRHETRAAAGGVRLDGSIPLRLCPAPDAAADITIRRPKCRISSNTLRL